MEKRFVAAFVVVALVSSGFTYAVQRFQSSDAANNNVSTIDLLRSQISNLNSSLVLLSAKLHSANVSLSRISLDLEELSDKSTRDMNLTQQEIESLESSVYAAQANIETLQTRISEIVEELEKFIMNMTTITNDVRGLQLTSAAIQEDMSSLEKDVLDIGTEITNILLGISEMQTQISDLQSKTVELEDRINALNSTDKVTIRVSFLDFTIWYGIPPPLPADYLFDVGVYVLDENGQRRYPSISSARSGHSRFIRPTFVELVIRNGTEYNGAPLSIHLGDEVHVYVVAYFHLDDAAIDINPDPAWGPQPVLRSNESGSQLFIAYSIGTVKVGSVDGRDDGYLDFSDAYLQYRIETFYG